MNYPRACWAPFGVRPIVPKKVTREYVYLYVAVFACLGKIVSLILPRGNTAMMNLFLKEVSEQLKKYFLILVMDLAPWHKSNGLEIPENIRIIPLPKGSPELNPCEHIFEDIREKDIPNRQFNSLNKLENKLCSGLNRLNDNPKYLTSLTNFSYMNITL